MATTQSALAVLKSTLMAAVSDMYPRVLRSFEVKPASVQSRDRQGTCLVKLTFGVAFELVEAT